MSVIEREKTSPKLSYRIIRPGGNDTALVRGILPQPERKRINDLLMAFYPNVEQVGFTATENGLQELMMAGGEFCGNATRSAAYLALGGKPGQLSLQVSGVGQPLVAGVNGKGEAYAQMPVYPSPDKIQEVPGANKFIVEMEGITQVVDFNSDAITGITEADLKTAAMEQIRSLGLERGLAAGVMYARQDDRGISLTPVVYVRDSDTLFLETACGSGTTALGLVLSKKSGKNLEETAVVQPSGMEIKVSVIYKDGKFKQAAISGPIQTLASGKLTEGPGQTFITERLENERQLVPITDKIAQLYAGIFSQAPYFEQFAPDEINRLMGEYLNQGLLFVSRTPDKVLGFGAALPLSGQKEIAALAKERGFIPENTWYMADLGVDPEYRRQGFGRELAESRLTAMAPGATALMRTSVDNVASRALYESLGFKEVPGMIQEVEMPRTDGSVRKDPRLFLYKNL